MEGNSIRIIITGLLVTETLLWGFPDYIHGKAICVAAVYHFFHANIFHLAANLLSVWLIFLKGRRYPLSHFILAYIIATLSWYCSAVPVVGVSNFIFALLGLRTPSLKDRWWRQSSVVTFLAVTVGMAFVPNVSAVTHIVSFALGCICAGVGRIFKSIGSDYARASYHQ